MHAMRFVVFLAAAVASSAVAPACAPSDPDVEIAYYTPPGQEDPCPPNGCGGNSPVVDGVYFWSLHAGGHPSPEGVRITGVHKQGLPPMQLWLAEGDRLIGVAPGNPAQLIADSTALIGARIDLWVKGLPYELRLVWAEPSERFWVGAKLPIWQYWFRYRPLFGPDQRKEHALCSEGDGDPSMVHAFTFGGDVYDPDTKEIETGAVTAGWINIACAESAIYKMHKIGHTSAAQSRLGLVTTEDQRRAMLNAWTSKVCPTSGEAFTHQGEPITLRDSFGWFDVPPYNAATATTTIEAIWNRDGAACLNVHRLHEDDPDIYAKIATACGGVLPPSCPDPLGDWTTLGHVKTGNP